MGSFKTEKRIFWVCCNGIKFNFLLALSKPHVTACEPLVSSKSPYRTANSWLFLILCLFKSLYDMVQPSTLQASIKVPWVLKIHMIQSRKDVDSTKIISFRSQLSNSVSALYDLLNFKPCSLMGSYRIMKWWFSDVEFTLVRWGWKSVRVLTEVENLKKSKKSKGIVVYSCGKLTWRLFIFNDGVKTNFKF